MSLPCVYTVNIILSLTHRRIESICGRLLEEFRVICDEDLIDYVVALYSKSKKLSLSIFAVNVINFRLYCVQRD